MAGKHGRNGFDDDNVNPFAGGSVPPATNSRLSPLSHEPADFYNVDIPLDSSKDLKKREKELQAMEAELNKRERELKRKEDAASQEGRLGAMVRAVLLSHQVMGLKQPFCICGRKACFSLSLPQTSLKWEPPSLGLPNKKLNS